MISFSELLAQGTSNAWFFIPSAILLGALHGLEPGHSKTMMAAFIIAVRGTVTQAILLGLAATVSHTLIVWLIALTGLYFGSGAAGEDWEPYLQILSGSLIIAIALWMVWRTYADQQTMGHHSHEAVHELATPWGAFQLEIFEEGVPAHWRLRGPHMHDGADLSLALEILRPDGTREGFSFQQEAGFFKSTQDIAEPHEFKALLTLAQDGQSSHHELEFVEHHDHDDEDQDAHERAHAADIQRRFANRQATTGQIIVFGLTGGLIPCPASITVLLICLQLKQFVLGATLVLCFSIGLALTMVGVGVAAALSVRHVSQKWAGFNSFARRAPYISSLLIVLVGLYSISLGVAALAGHA